MDWEKVSKDLQAPLDPAAIKPPPQGKYGEYVDGLHVIREANRIFGHNGWSYEVTRLDMVSRVEASNGNVRVGYLCAVRANVDGVVREGTAVGSGTSKPDNEADAHEGAIKEAETDALKRALRSFGNTFGLALYEKDKSKREVATPEVKRDPRKIADAMIAKMGKVQNFAQWQAATADDTFFKALTWLEGEAPPMANEVKKAKGDAKMRVDPAGQSPDGKAA